jgi:hypothetical protein
MARIYRVERMKRLVWHSSAGPGLCFFSLTCLSVFMLCACGEIRFSQTAPEARDFHPRTVALLSLEVGGHEEARDVLDRIITGAMTDRGWFQRVVSAQAFQDLLKENDALRTATLEYAAKLKAVNYSDPDLSRKIAELSGIDAFLLVNIDYWYYTKEADKDLAKVGLTMKMMNAGTGVLMWKAGHHLAVDYKFLKPELESVAADVVKQIVRVMPH